MPEIRWPAFIVQQNDLVVISHGPDSEEVVIDLALFQELEPGFVMKEYTSWAGVLADHDIPEHSVDYIKAKVEADVPVRVVQVCYEDTGAEKQEHHVMSNNLVLKPKQSLIDQYAGYIANHARYVTEIEARAHPLFGITDIDQAKDVAGQMIIDALEAGFAAQQALSGYLPSEESTFTIQLQEAAQVKAGATSGLKVLPQILKDGETLEELADKVIANEATLLAAITTVMKTKRDTLQAISALATPAEIKAFADNFIAGLAGQGA